MMLWRCEICGYLHGGDGPPVYCAKCGASGEKFVLLDEEESEMMRDALLVRAKYGRIFELLTEVLEVAQSGIALNMDEECNQIFQRTQDEVARLHKMIRDELAGYAQQCVWAKLAGDAV